MIWANAYLLSLVKISAIALYFHNVFGFFSGIAIGIASHLRLKIPQPLQIVK